MPSATLYDYSARQDSSKSAERVLARILDVVEELAAFPERGPIRGELLDLGIREYRQTFFKPYRVIYRVIGLRVYIYVIAHGRQEVQSLLARRLLCL